MSEDRKGMFLLQWYVDLRCGDYNEGDEEYIDIDQAAKEVIRLKKRYGYHLDIERAGWFVDCEDDLGEKIENLLKKEAT